MQTTTHFIEIEIEIKISEVKIYRAQNAGEASIQATKSLCYTGKHWSEKLKFEINIEEVDVNWISN